MHQVTRRHFMTAAAASAAACAICPNCTGAAPRSGNAGPVDVGTLTDFARDGVTDTWARDARFFVVRTGGKLYAASSICTHEPKRLVVSGNELLCREHKAAFSLSGQVIRSTRGKAPRSPLPRYAISVNDKGRIIVDTSKKFDEKHWDDAGASIAVK